MNKQDSLTLAMKAWRICVECDRKDLTDDEIAYGHECEV